MATTTTNLGLVLPVGSENVSRQIINENNTKIDTAIGQINARKYPIRNVPTTVSIGAIPAGGGTSGSADVQIPAGCSFMTIVPRYTTSGLCIASAYPVSGAASGYQRITVYVRNVTTAAVSNETANVDVLFSMN